MGITLTNCLPDVSTQLHDKKGHMSPRVLHILSQRPARTGSGVTLDAIAIQAAAAGWQQAAIVGVPWGDVHFTVGDIAPENIHPLWFAAPSIGDNAKAPQSPDLAMLIPGMSDVMPYPSTVWSTMTTSQLDEYRQAWRRHLSQVITDFSPDLIHSHHVWLVSALLKEVAPKIPVVTTCHSTGLRQIILTPHLASEVKTGCARIDRFCVLREDHGQQLQQALNVSAERITVTGAGYRPELFYQSASADRVENDLLYVGKLSRAKGLPWLLEAFGNLLSHRPELKLHIAGGGAGKEAKKIERDIESMAPHVVFHGPLSQEKLAVLMRSCGVCILPSFYEGVPLVLVEAAACGCKIVATELPGIVEQIVPRLHRVMDLVPLPRLREVDQPVAADLPAFVAQLEGAIQKALHHDSSTQSISLSDLESFSWEAVFQRVEQVWRQLLR
ncbi:MAG: glycosyltransferase involved in cell wall biosynthesis [Candidatus Krumholzibacteriia bacterium]